MGALMVHAYLIGQHFYLLTKVVKINFYFFIFAKFYCSLIPYGLTIGLFTFLLALLFVFG